MRPFVSATILMPVGRFAILKENRFVSTDFKEHLLSVDGHPTPSSELLTLS